jgi:hypothetical protein
LIYPVAGLIIVWLADKNGGTKARRFSERSLAKLPLTIVDPPYKRDNQGRNNGSESTTFPPTLY